MNGVSRRSVIGGAAAGLCWTVAGRVGATVNAGPQLVFVSNMLADYLHLLLFRASKPEFPPFAPPGFDKAPRLGAFVAVPEAVASARLVRYDQLRPFIATTFAALPATRVGPPHPKILSYSDTPVALAEVQRVVAAGRPFFPAFADYWHLHIEPKVRAQIAAWQLQDARSHPLQELIRLQRLSLRSARLQAVAMPFHPAASGNYSPAAIYSSLFERPNLCWFLGHEASHLIWSAAVGTPLESRAEAAPILARAAAQKIDLEETMCLLMQVQLSKACGETPASYRISAEFEAGPRKKLLVALEDDWDTYRADPRRWPNLQVYVLDKARVALA